MDYYVPKRRIPVTVWSGDLQGCAGQIFLDLDSSGPQHATILDMLNQTAPFLPVAVGDEGRIHLFHRGRITRVTPARQVLQADVYARGFEPWREERAQVVLADGTRLEGRVWMPLERETQRLSDYLNRLGARFFVVLTATGIHLVNALAVAEVELEESAGSPLSPASLGNVTAD
jgi:hypothetical protein